MLGPRPNVYGERESHAVYYLQEQDMTRFDAVNYISHGIAKAPGRSETRRVQKETEQAAFIRSTSTRNNRKRPAIDEPTAKDALGGSEEIRQLEALSRRVCREILRDEAINLPDRKGLDVVAILNDLYASHINASISWIWDRGFDVILGDPPIPEGLVFATIGGAIAWLRDQACAHYPDSEFARKYSGFA